MPTSPKYLYLTKEWHLDAWLHGGVVPLRLASAYRSNERNGIFTPDENIIDTSTHSLDYVFGKHNHDAGATQDIQLEFINVDTGEKHLDHVKIDRRYEDGVVLCLSNCADRSVARRLKKVACVRIDGVEALKTIIDTQLGKKGVAGDCAYTNSHLREHFLKSVADSWQQEYRMFWNHDRDVNITLPPGIATLVGVLPPDYRPRTWHRPYDRDSILKKS